jgi:hypothetical protein
VKRRDSRGIREGEDRNGEEEEGGRKGYMCI